MVQSLTTWKDWWAQMSEIKLLALDLDGTLFTKDKQVTAENRAALKAAEAKGVHVVITTGRPSASYYSYLGRLGFVRRQALQRDLQWWLGSA